MKKQIVAIFLAGVFSLPMAATANPWDPPEVITRKLLVNPVNYWWYRAPADRGEWDYFSPVSQPQEPVAISKRYKLVYNSGYPFNGIQGYVDSPVFVRRNETRSSR